MRGKSSLLYWHFKYGLFMGHKVIPPLVDVRVAHGALGTCNLWRLEANNDISHQLEHKDQLAVIASAQIRTITPCQAHRICSHYLPMRLDHPFLNEDLADRLREPLCNRDSLLLQRAEQSKVRERGRPHLLPCGGGEESRL